jgi:hypothetical protein
MQIGFNLRHGALGLINARKKILWVWTRYIEGKCKKDTLNENLSMAMYALVNKLLQKKFWKEIQIQKKFYYEIEENYKPHLSIFQLLQNLWSVSKLL